MPPDLRLKTNQKLIYTKLSWKKLLKMNSLVNTKNYSKVITALSAVSKFKIKSKQIF